MSRGEAATTTDTARRLARLPQTMTALGDGSITAAQVQAAAKAARDLPLAALGGLDALVVEQGPDSDAQQLRSAVDDYAHRRTPDSLAQRQERAHRLRRLRIAKTPDDATALEGRLDLLDGEVVLTALAPLAAPRGADDARTSEQRLADALVEVCRRSLTAGDLPEVGGVRPHVTVVVSLDTLEGRAGAAPALLDRLGPICGETARLLACDAGLTRVITDGASQPLDVGREQRTVSTAQRKALAVRDGGCVGCRAPVPWCEAHHVKYWTDGGPSDLANLVLVCWRCHRDIHHTGKHPIRGPDGRWTLRRC
jgi:uncharacterized protein DUF222/HNH endonuclease